MVNTANFFTLSIVTYITALVIKKGGFIYQVPELVINVRLFFTILYKKFSSNADFSDLEILHLENSNLVYNGTTRPCLDFSELSNSF